MRVFVAIYDTEYGPQARAFIHAEGAELWRQEIAKEWIDMEFPDLDVPDDPEACANLYFESISDSSGPFESFTVEELEVEA